MLLSKIVIVLLSVLFFSPILSHAESLGPYAEVLSLFGPPIEKVLLEAKRQERWIYRDKTVVISDGRRYEIASRDYADAEENLLTSKIVTKIPIPQRKDTNSTGVAKDARAIRNILNEISKAKEEK